jgi:hypothetical protein
LCYWRAAIRRKNVATCWIQLQLHELQKNMPFKLWGITTKLPTKITNRIISWNTKPFCTATIHPLQNLIPIGLFSDLATTVTSHWLLTHIFH